MKNISDFVLEKKEVPFVDYDLATIELPPNVVNDKKLMDSIKDFFMSLGWSYETFILVPSQKYKVAMTHQVWRVPINK